MSDIQNEIIGFTIVIFVVLALAYYTKKKEDEYARMMKEEGEDEINNESEKDKTN